jgi:hypothetical protein
MPHPRHFHGLAATALIALTATAFALGSPEPGQAQAPGALRNPSVTHLMQQYGLGEAEAQRRIDLQLEIMDLADRLNTGGDANFAGIHIQHTPVYKVVVSFADKDDRKAFVQSLTPALRPHVQVRAAKRAKKSQLADLDALNAAFAGLNAPYLGSYDLANERYEFTVGDEATAARFRAAAPAAIKTDVVVVVGAIPGLESAPTGAVAGDTIRGGQTAFNSSGSSAACTFAYAVSYTLGGVAKRGILTAGHCPNTLVHKVGTRNITLANPDVERQTCGVGGKHDYQIMDTTGITTSHTIQYTDMNSIPEFPASGTLDLTGIKSFANQTAGMIMCKSGQTTGITCGEIVSGNASFRDNGTGCTSGTASTGFIKVSKSQQADLSAGGDSGGAWFMYPGTATTILGVGIHTAGGCSASSPAGSCISDTGTTAYSIYMPIDYIDDHNTTVATIKKP